jgi:hypothetical protein
MNYVYMLANSNSLPTGPNGAILPGYAADKSKLALKYENLLNQSKELCKKYTGPHSVLQIFLEKIIDCIGQIAL